MTPGEFVRRAERRKIGARSALIEHAALARGRSVERIGANTVLVDLAGRSVPFQDMNGPSSSAAAQHVCGSKVLTRGLLAGAGVATGRWRAFDPDDGEAAWAFADSLGAAVVKPASQAMSRGVATGITRREQFAAAWRHAAEVAAAPYARPRVAMDLTHPPTVVVEEQVEGADVRFFVVGDRVVSAIERRSASVEGDGRRSVAELIEGKNAERAVNPGLRQYPIPTEAEALDRLVHSRGGLGSVPAAGEVVGLRSVSTLAAGGDSVEVTEAVHPQLAEVAVASLAAIPGLRYGAVDVITPSITEAPAQGNHVVGEVEFAPGPMAHFPAVGEPRDVAGAILDLYAEEGAGSGGVLAPAPRMSP